MEFQVVFITMPKGYLRHTRKELWAKLIELLARKFIKIEIKKKNEAISGHVLFHYDISLYISLL